MKTVLRELAGEKTPGPLASFSMFHLLLALESISQKPRGRSTLTKELGLGEGTIRTILRRLTGAKLIAATKSGSVLSERGEALLREYESTLKKIEIKENELTLSNFSVAILVRGSAEKVRSGMEQRDVAVKNDAKGATTLMMKKGQLVFPSLEREVSQQFPVASGQILDLLHPNENDVIIIVSSESRQKAERAALAAAFTLLD